MTLSQRLKLAMQVLTRKELVSWDPSNARTIGAGVPWLRGVANEGKLTAPYAQDIWVYACVSAIASRIGSLSLQLWRPEGEDAQRRGLLGTAKAYRRRKSTQRPFGRCSFRKDFTPVLEGDLAALLARPNPETPAALFWMLAVTHLQLCGDAFLYKERMGIERGAVKELYLYPKSRMRCVTDVNGLLVGWIYQLGAKQIPIAKDDLIHLRLPNPYSDHVGLGPADVARLSIEQEFAANLYNKAFFENYGQVGGALKFPKNLTDQQFNRLLTNWRETRAGVARAYEVLILEGGGEYVDTAQSLKDMAFAELKKMSREEKAAAFGVPPAEVGIFEYANYANAAIQQKQFWFNKLLPLLHYIEGEVQEKLVGETEPGLVFEADLTGVQALKEEMTARVTQAKDLATMGWPINQVNRLLDLGFEDVPWGDDWWIGFSQVPARTLLAGPAIEPGLPADTGDGGDTAPAETAPRRAPAEKADAQRMTLWKGHVSRFQPIEQRYRKALREYFYEQRADVLRRLHEHPEALQNRQATARTKAAEEILFELDEQTGKLREVSRPYFDEALRRGGEAVWAEVGASGSFNPASPEARIQIDYQLRALAGIPERVRAQLERTIAEGLSRDESPAEMATRIREFYRGLSAGRAQTIARTETARAYNETRWLAMQQLGVEWSEWLSAGDEQVRHAPGDHAIDGEQRRLGEPFSNQLRFPHDPQGAPGNVINCRCVALPSRGRE